MRHIGSNLVHRAIHWFLGCSPFIQRSEYLEGNPVLHVEYCIICGDIKRSVCPKSGTWDVGTPCAGCYDDDSKYRVIGDHPILRRPDKGGMSYLEAKCYVHELNYAGYENIQMNLEKEE